MGRGSSLLPIAVPPLVLGFGFVLVFSSDVLPYLGNLWVLIAGHVVLTLPYPDASLYSADAGDRHAVFLQAGFQWRKAGCSMCLGMNDDKPQGREMSASSSNRSFIGRQGSPTGRTLLMSPAMIAAAAIAGEVADVREILR